MDWQEPVAIAVAASAALMLVRMQVQSYRRKHARACGNDCGCEGEGMDRAEPHDAPPN
jgi:hypothetical protein